MNEHDSEPTPRDDATNGGSDDVRSDRAAQAADAGREAENAQPIDAHTLPHVTGHSDAHYVNAAPTWMDSRTDPTTRYQTYDAAGDGLPAAQAPAAFAGPVTRRRSRRWVAITGAAAAFVLVTGAASGTAYALGHQVGQAASAASQRQALELQPQLSGPSGGTGTSPFGGGSLPRSGNGSSDGSGTGTSTQSSATPATAAEKKGVVTIVSVLNYDESYKSAGTGMIMTSNGLILTNNHVVQGATSIQVTDESTDKTYTAKVVGTDATNDVAVLQLEGASGLGTISFASDASVEAGDAVHSTGNAEGTGDLVTATGTVAATDQAITVQSESGTGTESLKGLIEVDSDVVSGDSGGPLRDSDGGVIGIITAASSGSAAVTGYAIPIDHALSIAKQIEAGRASSTVQIGLPAFLGAEIASGSAGSGAGVTIAGTVTGSAAASAGLVAGDTITALDGTTVTDSSSLTAAVTSHSSGDRVSVTWTDTAGASHTATVTLGDGPAA
ncbi:S1C family serine protease [Frigoribacterium sp. 2-23]|uniref:S1C family serine protease n=1 Tax=Frigoribacterium sp. 2-23 TaxID=3415006 RepID=UPI003C6ED187